METNKVNTGTKTKRVSLSEGTFRIFAKSVQDVTSNKFKKDRSGSTSTTSSSNESSPNKDSNSSPEAKSSDVSVLETPEKRKTLESLSPSKSHSPLKINRVDSPEKPLKSRRSIGTELEDLKENIVTSVEDKVPVPKNNGIDTTDVVDEQISPPKDQGQLGNSVSVKIDESKTAKIVKEDINTEKFVPPNKDYQKHTPLMPYNHQRRFSHNDLSNQNQHQQVHKNFRRSNPEYSHQPRHDSSHNMNQNTHARPSQRFDYERGNKYPNNYPGPRFRTERFSESHETKKGNKSEDREDWSNDLLDVQAKLDSQSSPKTAEVLSTSLKKAMNASSPVLSIFCHELDHQDTKSQDFHSDSDNPEKICVSDTTECAIYDTHAELSEKSTAELNDGKSDNDFSSTLETVSKTDKLSINDIESLDRKNFVRDVSEVDDTTSDVNATNSQLQSKTSQATACYATSTSIPVTSKQKTFKSDIGTENFQMTKRLESVDTEDWSDELTEVPTPKKDISLLPAAYGGQDDMTDLNDRQEHSADDKSKDWTECLDIGNVSEKCPSDLHSLNTSKLESDLNWAEGWTQSKTETSLSETGISMEVAINDISKSTGNDESSALFPKCCMYEKNEKSFLSTDNKSEILSKIEIDDLNYNNEDVLPNTKQPIVYLQDGVPRMKAIFARGGIRPSYSSRGAHSFIFADRYATASEEDIIKPHPLMSAELEGKWEKVLENDAEELDGEEVFDSEIKNTNHPRSSANPLKDTNNNVEESNPIVPGNVAPQFSQDIRRKASVKDDQKQISISDNQNVQSQGSVSRRSSFDRNSDNTESMKQSRPIVPRKNSNAPPTRNDRSLDVELKKIDDYLGLSKHQKKPEHHTNAPKKHARPRTHSFNERSGKGERKDFKTDRPGNRCTKSEDWSSELLDVHPGPHHFTEKHDWSSNSFQNTSSYSSKSIPIPENSLVDMNSNYSPYYSAENEIKRTSPQRISQNEKLSSLRNHQTDTRKQKSGGTDSKQIDISKGCDKSSQLRNAQYESVSSKEMSMDRDICGDKHGFLTSSKMSISNSGVAISDAFSDFSSVASDDDNPKQSDPDTVHKNLPVNLPVKSDSSISMKSKHHYRYSSQDMSISETISSMSTDQSKNVQKTDLNDMDYIHKPKMPPNQLEYPFYHLGKSPPGPAFDPRLFNPYIPFYPPYMYPPFYPGYDNTLIEQHQKMGEERRHIKQEKEDSIKPQKIIDSVKSVKPESERSDHGPNLSHLITVPLNKITDIEQAQLLLQFVNQLVRKVPHASGAYYRAVTHQGESSLEVGATTETLPQNKVQLSKSPQSSSFPSERRPPTFNDESSMNPHYQYPAHHYNPMKGPDCPHQDLPRQTPQYPNAAAPDDKRYHDFRNYYMNENQVNMDNLREPDSPNPSLVSYDITDEDDYYEETKNVRIVIGPQAPPLHDRRNIICNKLIEDSVNQKPLDFYNQEFPELGNGLKGPKRSVSDTDASIRKVIDRDIQGKETLVQKPTNIRYVPPHKRRFSEYGDSRPLTKFGAFNTYEENRNPYEVWKKYLKSSPTSLEINPNQTNYVKNNWREKITAGGESIPAKYSNVPSQSYYQESQNSYRRYTNGQIPDSLVNDAKLYRDPYRPYSDNRLYESSTPTSSMDSISSRSSYSSRLQNDNRLKNNSSTGPSFNQLWKMRFKDRSKEYQVPFIDSHCHLDLLYERLNFNGTYQEFLQRYSDCYPSNFAGCIAIFCYPRHFELNGLWKKLAEDDTVWISMGCHPKNAKEYNELVEDNMLKILKHPKVVAVGEIGLDYSGNQKQNESLQKIVFKRQLKIGLDVKKPIVIHCRDAEDDCLQIMEEIIPRNFKIQCHCFSGNFRQAKRWLSAFPNLYLGLTPVVTFSGAHAAHDVARNVPLNRLLLETDSPYFVPRPLNKEEQGVSLPGFALTVAEEVAHRRGIAVQEVLKHCRDNMTSLFGI